jgi:hypothetical protein
MSDICDEGPDRPSPVRLLAADLELVLKLLPRAQIVVGDIPQILGSLQRLEAAARTKSDFVEA